MTTYTHRFTVVPNANKATAKEVAKKIADSQSVGSADGMWNTGVNSSGTGTPTHWVCAGMIDTQFANLLGDAAATFAVYQQCGGTVATLTQVQALYAAAPLGTYIRSDSLGKEIAHLTALGLKLITGP